MRIPSFRSLIASFIFTTIIFIRPLIGAQNICIFPVSCGLYAKQQLENESFITALKNIIKRLLSCHPFTK